MNDIANLVLPKIGAQDWQCDYQDDVRKEKINKTCHLSIAN